MPHSRYQKLFLTVKFTAFNAKQLPTSLFPSKVYLILHLNEARQKRGTIIFNVDVAAVRERQPQITVGIH